MTRLLSVAAWMAIALAPLPLQAQDYKKGDVIEYKVRGAVPEKWEKGIIIKPLDGGKQYLIHEKPSQFFPEGPEVAYYPTELRSPAPVKKPDPNPTTPAPVPMPPNGTKPPTTPPDVPTTKVEGEGLLSEEDVLAYAKMVFGPYDPFQVKDRDAKLDQIRDYIKKRGTKFIANGDGDFYKKLVAQGTHAVRIIDAIITNYGKAPKLEDYYGTYLLRTVNRGSKSVTNEGTKIIITTQDAQYESGELTINKDGTYLWKLDRKDSEDKWLKGKWREAKPDEMLDYEAGPAIWLEKAKGGFDSMVRKSRVPDYADWIDVGWGKGRTPVEYGRRK